MGKWSFIKNKSHQSKADGFTLIELLVVMAILGIVTSLLYQMIATSSKNYSIIDDLTRGRNEGKISLEFIEAEIRRHDAAGKIAYDTNNECLIVDQLKIFYENEALRYEIEDKGAHDFTMGSWIKSVTFAPLYKAGSSAIIRKEIQSITVTVTYFVDKGHQKTESMERQIIIRSYN